MVELRKRKEAPTAPPPLTKRNSSTAKKMSGKAKAVLGGNQPGDSPGDPASTSASVVPPGEGTGPGSTTLPEVTPVAEADTAMAGTDSAAMSSKFEVGSVIPFDTEPDFGGALETHDGNKTTLKQLLDQSGAGIVIFTYPKASTPGCTTQACLFRDNYLPITGASLSIYGLSTDSPKSNTTFVTKQNLQYPLLCDPSGSLIKAIGLGKPGNKTQRGSIVIDKQNHVKVHAIGGPQTTLDAVLNYVKGDGMEMGASTAVGAPPADDPHATEEAAKLAGPPQGGVGMVNMPDAPTSAKELPEVPADAPGVDTDVPMKMDEVPLIREASKEEQDAATTAAEVADVAKGLDGTPQPT